MKRANDSFWDLQAGEYVLGCLSARKRRLLKTVMNVDAGVREQVCRWQHRLDPLNELTEPIAPPDHVWTKVLSRLQDESAQNDLYHNETND